MIAKDIRTAFELIVGWIIVIIVLVVVSSCAPAEGTLAGGSFDGWINTCDISYMYRNGDVLKVKMRNAVTLTVADGNEERFQIEPCRLVKVGNP